MSLNGGTSATYQYDVINRLTQLTDNASLNTTFAYDPTNKPTSRSLPNGVATSYQYDGLDRLSRLTHSKTGNTLADFQYQFNAVNNITQMTDGAGTHNYTYDTRDRLTAASHPNQTNENYTLDDVGNRTASHQGSTYTYQAFNRLVAANGASFGYDANGNLTSKTDASGSWTYSWDYENRLKQASKSGGGTVTYTYDALGRRIQRTSSAGATTKFVYDGADVLRDLDGNGNTVEDYLNGPGIDNKLRETSGATTSYFVSDHLETTRALADPSGNVSSNFSYDSFGSITSGSTVTRYTYAGRESDPDIGLIYYRARWYDPQQGRFVSNDPIGLKGGINSYAYVDGDPMSNRDPTGLCADKQPCDVRLPGDENDLAVIATLLGEASTPGEGSWGPDEYGPKAYKKPSYVLTPEDVSHEMDMMVAVVNNRLTSPAWRDQYGFKSWKDVVEQPEQFLGYPNEILNNLGFNGDVNCERARLATQAVKDFHDAPFQTPFLYWKGIKQHPKGRKPFIVRRDGAFRWANTDFMTKERK